MAAVAPGDPSPAIGEPSSTEGEDRTEVSEVAAPTVDHQVSSNDDAPASASPEPETLDVKSEAEAHAESEESEDSYGEDDLGSINLASDHLSSDEPEDDYSQKTREELRGWIADILPREPDNRKYSGATARQRYAATKAHEDLITKVLTGNGGLGELDKSLYRRYLQSRGDMGGTILHEIRERWSCRLEPLFDVIMERFPTLFLVMDHGGKTILDVGNTPRKNARFVRYFVKRYSDQSARLVSENRDVLHFLLNALNRPEVWEELLGKLNEEKFRSQDAGPFFLSRDKKNGDTFLHNVVLCDPTSKPWIRDIIQHVASLEPETLTIRNDDGYPIYCHRLNHLRRDILERHKQRPYLRPYLPKPLVRKPGAAAADSGGDEISMLILHEMYRRLQAASIRDILLVGGRETEFDLDLEGLIDTDVSGLEAKIRRVLKPLKFESHLRCVWIPSWKQDTRSSLDIRLIFDNLRAKGVRQIQKLEVDESVDDPHSDETIRSAIQHFGIRELSWKKTDMCHSIVMEIAPEVEVLWLYSSGNRAVLRSWSAYDGLCMLKNLHTVYVSVMSRIETKDSVKSYLDEFSDRFRDAAKSNGRIIRLHIDVFNHHTNTGSMTWSSAVQPQRLRIRDDDTQWGYLKSIAAEAFDKKFQETPEPPKRVRVAIIDDGIDIGQVKNICVGASFASADEWGGRLKPYYIPDSGRGTAICKEIQTICPMSEFYIGRVDSQRSNIEALIDALNWVTGNNVDIIVFGMLVGIARNQDMRFDDRTMQEKNWIDMLEDLLWSIRKKEIVMFCAAGAALPAGDAGVFQIAATKWDGAIQEPAPLQADFTVSVEDIQLEESIPKSSIAAARVAGLAALMMAAIRNSGRNSRQVITPGLLHDFFRSLSQGDPKAIGNMLIMRWLLDRHCLESAEDFFLDQAKLHAGGGDR